MICRFENVYTLMKLVVEHKIDASRMYNVDETSFMPKGDSRKVIAIKGSPNVWQHQDKANFHMTVVAAVGADGRSIPPLLILPGIRVLKDEVCALNIENACITGAPKGFSNTELFQKWLVFFASQLHLQSVKRPMILIADNSSTHIDIGKINFKFKLRCITYSGVIFYRG